MGHFRSNLRDLEFNLFEVFRVQDRLGTAPFDGVDLQTARDTLTWFESLPADRRTKLRAGLSAEREAQVLRAWEQSR